jgi:hypothetical protein
MATKKAAAKTTALTKWQEKFAGYAKQDQDQLKGIGTGGRSIKFGRGKINIGDTVIKDGRIEVVILGYCAHNRFFKGKYNAAESAPPVCYSFSNVFNDEDMKPHAAAAEKQHEDCASCPNNACGSAETGRGKACQNTARLGLLLSDDLKDGPATSAAELANANVSPTNLKHLKAYVDRLAEDHECPTWAAVTEIIGHDDPETQIKLEFKLVDLITDDEVLTALEKRFLKIQDVLQVPYQTAAEKPTTTAGRSQKFAGNKKATRK